MIAFVLYLVFRVVLVADTDHIAQVENKRETGHIVFRPMDACSSSSYLFVLLVFRF